MLQLSKVRFLRIQPEAGYSTKYPISSRVSSLVVMVSPPVFGMSAPILVVSADVAVASSTVVVETSYCIVFLAHYFPGSFLHCKI